MTDMNETNLSHTLPGQERYVAPLEETPLKDVDSVDESAPASSLWADAWRTLRKNPMFIISAVLIPRIPHMQRSASALLVVAPPISRL